MTPPGTEKPASGSQLSVSLYACPKQHVQKLAFFFFFFFVVHENLTSQNPESLLVIVYSICLVYMYSIYSICLVSTITIHFFLHLYDMEDEKASFTNTLTLLFNDSESVVAWRLFFFEDF